MAKTPATAPPAAARATPIADQVRDVSTWYQQQTGFTVTPRQLGQILAIMLHLEQVGGCLGRAELLAQSDPLWHTRAKRDEDERRAALVGRTVERGSRRPVYLYLVTRPQGTPAAEVAS